MEHHLFALARSWHGAQQGLADPTFRAYLEQSLERLRSTYEPSEPTSDPSHPRGQGKCGE